MLELTSESIKDTNAWNDINVVLPQYDIDRMRFKTLDEPSWVHFGAGNIFRGFTARVAQRLLDLGLIDKGIIAVDCRNSENIDLVFKPHDNLSLMVDLKPDGNVGYEVIGSVAQALFANTKRPEDLNTLMEISRKSSLQIVSFTITEKGYAITGLDGKLLPNVVEDMKNGPSCPTHAMAIVCTLLYERYRYCHAPIAMLSMDNCSHNGQKLFESVLRIAKAWMEYGYVDSGFIDYISDDRTVSFPWSMIDKITPLPDASVAKKLEALGIDGMQPIMSGKGVKLAPFVNAEVPEYLVIEDSFPNGRPPFEKAGVLVTNRTTVNRAEEMKVTTCLNPLHTSLAIFGCLLGYTKISDEMKDPMLVSLITKLGYNEGLPVVTNPEILDPRAFINEVICERLPNPFIPDAPQRIICDTSLKIPVRFGVTLKAYLENPALDVASLTYIPLTIAGWLRYLIGVDDSGAPIEQGFDPMLEELKNKLSSIKFGSSDIPHEEIDQLLSNSAIFGIDLVSCKLSIKIQNMLAEMLCGPGAVKNTIAKYV